MTLVIPTEIGSRYGSLFLSEWGDSNARPLRPERSALPTALHSDPVVWHRKGNCFFRDMHFFVLKNLLELKKSVSLHPHLRQMPWCHSSVGRAKDWKSLCPWFDSRWHHAKPLHSLCGAVLVWKHYYNITMKSKGLEKSPAPRKGTGQIDTLNAMQCATTFRHKDN